MSLEEMFQQKQKNSVVFVRDQNTLPTSSSFHLKLTAWGPKSEAFVVSSDSGQPRASERPSGLGLQRLPPSRDLWNHNPSAHRALVFSCLLLYSGFHLFDVIQTLSDLVMPASVVGAHKALSTGSLGTTYLGPGSPGLCTTDLWDRTSFGVSGLSGCQ